MAEEKELKDQPQEEESNSQPESSEEEVDQPQEEESFLEINGEQVSLSELKEGYMRESDYRRKTQILSQQRKELEALRGQVTSKTKSERSQEEQEVYDFLKRNNVVTKDELSNHFKQQQAAQEDLLQFNNWMRDTRPEPKVAEAVYNLGKAYPDMSYQSIYKDFFEGSTKKVVSKKVVGMKGKKSADVEAGSVSRAQIQKWINEGTYEENRGKVERALAEGKLIS